MRQPEGPDPLAWAVEGARVAYVDDAHPDAVQERVIARVTRSQVVTTEGERWRRQALQRSGPWTGALRVLSGIHAISLAPFDHPQIVARSAPARAAASAVDTTPAGSTGPGAPASGAPTDGRPSHRRATRTVSWVGIDDPDRLDAASVHLGSGELTAAGTSRTSAYALAWTLTTEPGWITRRLEVAARGVSRGAAWSRDLVLERDPSGRWRCETRAAGPFDAPAPGFSDASVFDGALDCDLGLCPVTNTLPILRLGLLAGDVPETELTMAWVEVPSLRVLPSQQVYASGQAAGGEATDGEANSRATVRYASRSRDFAGTLVVDEDGLVVDYPGLARR
jgi:hypothetical protein